MIVTIKGHEIDTTKFPPTSMDYLVNKALRHLLGNVLDSKWVAERDKRTELGLLNTSDTDKADFISDQVTDTVAELVAGTYHVRTSAGPRAANPLEAEVKKLTESGVKAFLVANGARLPVGDEKLTVADGTEYTRAQLLSWWLENHPEINQEAEANVAKRQMVAKAAIGGLDLTGAKMVKAPKAPVETQTVA